MLTFEIYKLHENFAKYGYIHFSALIWLWLLCNIYFLQTSDSKCLNDQQPIVKQQLTNRNKR